MSSVIIKGDTSGQVELASPAVAGSSVQTLVAATGTLAPLIAGTAVTASGTSVDFTGIPSWVKRITVMLSVVSTNGTSGFLIQLGDSGGIETSGYTGIRTTVDTTPTAAAAGVTTGLFVSNLAASTDTVTGIAVFTNLTGNTWTGSGSFSRNSATVGAQTIASTTKTLSDILTQIRITTGGGTDTFDAGTINILYE
jgi:hypothetical protein